VKAKTTAWAAPIRQLAAKVRCEGGIFGADHVLRKYTADESHNRPQLLGFSAVGLKLTGG
jgi:hypothetical protein